MVFISAGHAYYSKNNKDSGAVGIGGTEGLLTVDYRNLVQLELDKLGVKYISDTNEESLAQYLDRIKTGPASCVLEFHFDAASNPNAGGCTSIVSMDADRLDLAFAKELAASTSTILGVKNRGIINESETPRKRLGLMREQGIVTLLEMAYVTNKSDIEKYHQNKTRLAKEHALIIQKFDAMI